MLINQVGNQKGENDISPLLKDLLLYLEHAHRDDDVHHDFSEDAPFFLGQISGEAGRLYEKVRAVVDNKEEHFLRRYAIRRILKRVMWFSDDPKVITGRLLRELYKAGYLPPEMVSRHAEEDIVHTISAFLALSEGVTDRAGSGEFLVLRSRLLDIIAGALEDSIYPTYLEESVVRLLARITHEQIEIAGFEVSKELLPKLIYLSAWKSLFDADKELLIYKLWLNEFPDWDHLDDNSLTLVAHSFQDFIARADVLVVHPFVLRLTQKLHNTSIALTVLYELLKRYGRGIEALATHPTDFLSASESIIQEKYHLDLRRAGKKARNAVMYILATKAVLAGVIESTAIVIFKQKLALIPLFINMTLHPTLLFAFTSRLSLPQLKNTERLLALLSHITYGKALPPLRLSASRFGVLGDFILAIYIVLAVIICYGIVSVLMWLHFHVVDMVLFIFFFALILYIGFRIRHGARRMQLRGGEESLIHTSIELLALPVVALGRYLVTRFASFNLIAMFMDFFIELPFKLVLEFFELFSRAIKEKRDDIYS